MLTADVHLVTLWVHITAACVWIGGQITVAAMLPLARRDPGLSAQMGRRFQYVAWPAFALLLATGVLNILYLHMTWAALWNTDSGRTLALKLVLVAISGVAAATHVAVVRSARVPRHRVPAVSALFGLFSLGPALTAAFLGVLIHGG